jgi:hypothetical protein
MFRITLLENAGTDDRIIALFPLPALLAKGKRKYTMHASGNSLTVHDGYQCQATQYSLPSNKLYAISIFVESQTIHV